MNIIFVGVQGSGKGTQAKIVAEKMGLCHISTGDLLRDATGELGERVKKIIADGNLISDKLMLDILRERMSLGDCENGIILDGFPRNLEQAKLLGLEIEINKVVEIKISDEESLRRLSGRVSCKDCGEGYNICTAPRPKVLEKCDKCGGRLMQRADDNEDAIAKRIKTYHNETEPILDFYGEKVVVIDGEREIGEISEDILRTLS
jgi:adenylate kinase